MIFFIITLIATTIGGIAGMGGGVIIKPMLDLLGGDIAVIAVLSAVTVLSMCIVSIIKQSRMGFKIDKSLIFLAVSALVGGIAGNQLFALAMNAMSDEAVNIVQIVISIALLIFALLKDVAHKTAFTKPIAFIIIGFLLGAVSTFIGIGGGPINVAVLVVFFGFGVKKAAVASIFMILFAQLMNVITMMIEGDMFSFDLSALWFMIPAAVIGGLAGAVLSKKLESKHVNVIFIVAVCCIISLNVYNLVNLL